MKSPIIFNDSTVRKLWWVIPLCLLLAVIGANMPSEQQSLPVLEPFGEPASNPPAAPDAAETPVRPKPVHLSQHITEYHIGVSYDEKKQELIGEQTVTWKHPGKKPAADLYFHLYPNAFQSLDSTFMRESGGQLRGMSMKPGGFGSMTITSIKSMEGDELIHRLKYVQPDDNNRADQTLAKLRLPSPVAGGSQISLRIRFTVKLPKAFARMGVADDFVMAGQWFPKLAVYEPAGTRGRKDEGWSLHQYHGNSEFYSNFGIYNVAINVPDTYTVAATGFPTKPAAKRGGRKIYQFYADDVHDFAWAASPNFIYAEEPFSNKHVPGVKIKLYLDPRHEHLKERYLRAAKLSLTRFSQWYGAYPYATLTIVVPPASAEGTGGMEYPTFITAWAAAEDQPGLELERVVAHEIAHQYWYGIVASHEAQEAWLDEAFASYSEMKLMQTEYDESPNLPLEAIHITSPAPLKLDAWKYADSSQYAANVYTRGKLVLLSIEREIGSDAMRKVLRTYYQQWKFKHPATADFQRTLESVTGADWTAFFDQFVYGKETLDYEVTSIRIKPVNKEGKKLYENTVVISRLGGHHLPVPIIFYFADNTITERIWDGMESSTTYTFTSDQKLKWVAVDPHYNLLMENKQYNNLLQARVDPIWKMRLNLIIGKSIEALLGWSL